MLQTVALPFGLAFVLSAALTALIVWLARRYQWLAPVREERWHRQPKPNLGGVAIFASYLVTMLCFAAPDPSDNMSANNALVISFYAGGMFVLGLLDDFFDLKPYIKLIFEIAIASLVTWLGVMVAFVDDQVLAMTLSVLWIVVISNAFNLLDNMDGLSGGIAVITGISFLLVDMINGAQAIALPAAVMIGSVLGFLIFNFPPAKIFMGDCGSLVVGFLLAVLSIKGTWQQASNLFLLLVTPVLLLGVPIFDTMVVSLQRLLHGRSIYQGGRDHSSHRLVALGMSEKQAVLSLYGLAIVLGTIAVVSYAFNVFVTIQLVLLMTVFLVSLGLFLSDAKIYQRRQEDGVEPMGFTLPIPLLLHKRRLVEIVIDVLLIVVAYIGSYLLRFDGEISPYNWQLIRQSLPIIVPAKLVTMLLLGMYNGIWKYVDFADIRKIFFSLAMASLGAISLLLGIYRFSGFSRSLFLIDFLMLAFLIVGFRVVLRLLRESLYGYAKFGTSILVVGAGEAGQWVLNELRKDRRSRLMPVGVIDDDRWKQGRKIYGVPILGGRNDLVRIAAEHKIQEIILAIPSAPAEERQILLELCQATGLPVRILEGITRWSALPHPAASDPGDNDSNRNGSNNGPPSPSDPGPLH